ncbi:MAG: hormogonium polysaccharide biosynthesis glycosyltransferase HpsE [Synechococcales bacterium]|nr:hormogonium polysaccharide biosynthesis glycosyltransferase HpsE [Synechococcales bacterium]
MDQTPPFDFTVAIPTYNGEQRLPDVLDALRSQQVPPTFKWEIIVVDNNSSDRTSQVVHRYQEISRVPIRYWVETQQGAAYARDRAVRLAQSDLIGFLDDDNIPDPDWVASAWEFAAAHPQAGAFGSQIYGDYEATVPPDLERLVPFLAITQRGAKPLLYAPQRNLLPPAAGLVVRRQAWLERVPARPVLVGRVHGDMLAGEDIEVLTYIQQGNWEIWYNPTMRVAHKIPQRRLERDYLLPFFRGIGHSRYLIRMLKVPPHQRPLMTVLYMLNDLRKVALHLLKYRARVQTDLAAACELALFTSSFMSPLYCWRHGLRPPAPQ